MLTLFSTLRKIICISQLDKKRLSLSFTSCYLHRGARLCERVLTGFDGTSDRNSPTPIQHIVVIFQENVSFDHYFGTYPNAANPPNEPQFTAAPGTPSVIGLTGSLLTDNPNALASGNSSDNPARLDRQNP